MDKIIVTFKGSARNTLEGKVRAIISQCPSWSRNLQEAINAIEYDLKGVKTGNHNRADVNFEVKGFFRWKDPALDHDRVEVWHEVKPGCERLIATLTMQP